MKLQTLDRWLRRLPVILTSVGLIVCLAVAFAPSPSSGSGAIPLGPMDRTLRSPPFRGGDDNGYTVDLEVDRKLPSHETSCLLGLPEAPAEPRRDCGDDRPTFMVNWTLYENGRPLAEGGSEEGEYVGSGAAFAQRMARLNLRRDATYVLQAIVDGDLGRLRQANPRLRVNAPPGASNGGNVWRAVWLTGALVFAGLLIEFGRRRLSAPRGG